MLTLAERILSNNNKFQTYKDFETEVRNEESEFGWMSETVPAAQLASGKYAFLQM